LTWNIIYVTIIKIKKIVAFKAGPERPGRNCKCNIDFNGHFMPSHRGRHFLNLKIDPVRLTRRNVNVKGKTFN
jgi:hypothetical protein